MPRKTWFLVIALLLVGMLLGAALLIASIEINRHTSTDAFCTSCHTMQVVAAEPRFRASAHRSNKAGVLASCGDCHIPADSWFRETYTHMSQAVRDVYAELTGNFDDPAIWQARRQKLAARVRTTIRSQDSVTCRKCHDAAAIRPTSDSGRAAHAAIAKDGTNCIVCHLNAGHAAAARP